jgi:hypothetical protein
MKKEGFIRRYCEAEYERQDNVNDRGRNQRARRTQERAQIKWKK